MLILLYIIYNNILYIYIQLYLYVYTIIYIYYYLYIYINIYIDWIHLAIGWMGLRQTPGSSEFRNGFQPKNEKECYQ